MTARMLRFCTVVSLLAIIGTASVRAQLTSPVNILPSTLPPIPPTAPSPRPSVWSYDWTGISRSCSPPYISQQLFFGSAFSLAQLGTTEWGIECNGKNFSSFSDTNDVVLNARHAHDLIMTNLMPNRALRFGTTPSGGSTDVEHITVLGDGPIGFNNSHPREQIEIGDLFTMHSAGWKFLGYNFFWNTSQNRRMDSGPASRIAFTDHGELMLESYPTGNAGSVANNGNYFEMAQNYTRVWNDTDGELFRIDRPVGTQIGASYFKHRVYIGTSDPGLTPSNDTFMLAVNGSIKSREVIVENMNWTSWPDYVFESNYPLMPLDSLRSWVSANKHLPGIPAAGEVAKNGVNVGTMQADLLKKVEELTLYVLKQDEENRQLRKQVNELEAAVHGGK